MEMDPLYLNEAKFIFEKAENLMPELEKKIIFFQTIPHELE